MGKLIIEISDELHTQLKQSALDKGTSIKDMVTKLIKRNLKGQTRRMVR